MAISIFTLRIVSSSQTDRVWEGLVLTVAAGSHTVILSQLPLCTMASPSDVLSTFVIFLLPFLSYSSLFVWVFKKIICFHQKRFRETALLWAEYFVQNLVYFSPGSYKVVQSPTLSRWGNWAPQMSVTYPRRCHFRAGTRFWTLWFFLLHLDRGVIVQSQAQLPCLGTLVSIWEVF